MVISGDELADFVLKEFLPYQLAVLSSQISREFSGFYRDKHGISVSEWRILAHLSQTKNSVSVREIFSQVDMDKSKVSRAATRLSRRGLLIKTQNAADKRLVELSLSKTGRDLVRELTPTAFEFERKVLGRLGSKSVEFRAAVDLLCSDDDQS